MILHVSTWEVCCGLAKHLSYWLPFSPFYRKHHVLAEVPPPWSVEDGKWSIEGVTSDRLWKRGTNEVADVIMREGEKVEAKVVHLQYDPTFFSFDVIRRISGWAKENDVKLVCTMHVVQDIPTYTLQNKAVMRWMDQVVVGSPAMKEAAENLAKLFHIPLRRPVKVIFLPVPPPPPRIKEKMSPSPVILSWGMLSGVKGILEVSRAVQMLRDYKYKDIIHLIIGKAFTGGQKENLEKLQMVAKGSDGGIRIIDSFLSDAEVYERCREAHVIVVNHLDGYPSSSGSVALSVASGTPTIVSRSTIYSGYPEVGAVLVSDGTAGSIAGQIERVLDDPGLLIKGREIMLGKISPSIVASQYESVYREMLA